MASAYPVEKLRRAMLQFVGGRTVQAVARAGLILLVVRLLPTDDYGAYMLIVGVSEMLLQFCSFGLVSAGQRYLPELLESAAPTDTRRFVLVLTVVQTMALFVLCGGAWWSWESLLPLVGFDPSQIERSRPALMLFLLVPAFRFVADLLDTMLEQGRAQSIRAFMPIGRILVLLALVLMHLEVDLTRVLMLDIGVTVICLVGAWLLMGGCLMRLPEPAEARPLPTRAMVHYAWHMATVEIMGTAQTPGAFRIVLANTLGIAESGLFAFLQSLQRVVGRFLPGVLLKTLVRPMLISRTTNRRGTHLLEGSIALLLKSNLLTVAAAAMVAFVAGDDIVAVASGGKFHGAGDTLVLMFVMLAFSSQRQLVEMLMQILNQTHVLRTTALLALPALAAVWFAAEGGLNAAVLIAGAGIGAVSAVNLWCLNRTTGGYRIDWWGTGGVMLPPVGAALLGLLVADTVGPWPAVGVSLLMLAGLLLLAKPFAQEEQHIARRGMGPLAGRALGPFVRRSVS